MILWLLFREPRTIRNDAAVAVRFEEGLEDRIDFGRFGKQPGNTSSLSR